MAAQDIKRDVTAWIRDEIGKVCFGEDYGYALSWAPAPAQGPQGIVMVPAQQLGLTRPREADVRREVADGIRQLRDLAKSKLSGSNGYTPKLAVPG